MNRGLLFGPFAWCRLKAQFARLPSGREAAPFDNPDFFAGQMSISSELNVAPIRC